VGGDVIVLNGGSSAGKSSLAVGLQQALPGTWLTFGVDDLIRALSHGPQDSEVAGALEFRADGSISVGAEFRRAEAGWYQGLAAMARFGTCLIIDEVFLDGEESQTRLQAALEGLPVLWVGVHCTPEVAERREIERGDRRSGLARHQAERVHHGVTYDIEVDTTAASVAQCVATIMARVAA
jgi:chloramphenicol 3-O phosphotransferase